MQAQVSLRTLGRMISATRYVVKPYMCYPTLMDSAFSILRGGGNVPWSLRREVLRTLGILGALDPYRYQQIQLYLRAERLRAESLAAGTRTGEGNINIADDGVRRQTMSGVGVAASTAPGVRASNMSVGLGGIGGNEGAAAAAAAVRTASTAYAVGSMPVGGTLDGLLGDLALTAQRRHGAPVAGHGLLDNKSATPPALLDQIHDGNQVRKTCHAV